MMCESALRGTRNKAVIRMNWLRWPRRRPVSRIPFLILRAGRACPPRRGLIGFGPD
jgi:hypothetical protein